MDSGQPEAECRVRPARAMLPVVSIIGVLAVFGLTLSDLHVWLKAGLSIAILVYAVWHLYHLACPAWRELLIGSNSAAIRHRSGETFAILAGRGAFVSPLYIGFRCRHPASGCARSVGIFRGQVDDEAFRRLSVTLKQASAP